MSNDKEILALLFQGISQRRIAEQLKVSRNTVSRVKAQADANGLTKDLLETMDEPQVHELLFPQKNDVIFYVQPDLEYIHKETKKAGVTVKLLWNEYVDQCKAINKPYYKYSFFCELYQNYVKENKLVGHLVWRPGQYLQEDYVGDNMYYIDPSTGKKVKVNIFVASLPFSGLIYAEGTVKTKEEDWVGIHKRMWEFFGGVTKFIVPDNLKTAVTSHKKYEDIIYNPTYLDMCNFYDTTPLAARVRTPTDKGHVESAVNICEQRIVARYRNYKFTSLLEVNMAIQEGLRDINEAPFQKKDGSRNSIFFEEEKPFLKPLPKFEYEYADIRKAKVQPNGHIAYSYNFYSVPYMYIKKDVVAKITSSKIDVFFEGTLIASHKRLYGRRYQFSTLPEHLDKNHRKYAEWNKDRFLRWARSIGKNSERLISLIFSEFRYEEQAYGICFPILPLAKKYGKEKFEASCENVLKYVPRPRFKHISAVLSSDTELYTGEKLKPTDKDDPSVFTRGKDYYDDDK